MRIPVIPIRSTITSTLSSHPMFSGTSVSMSKDTMNYKDLMRSVSKACGKETPIVIVDVKGMQKEDIDPNVLRKVRSKGNELWLMTGVRNSGDMIDALCGDIDRVMVPYHMTSDPMLKEMTELSDGCIPALFVERGKIYMKGREKSVSSVLKTLMNMNFDKIAVFNTSGEDDDRVYADIQEFSDVTVPYVTSGDDYDISKISEMGFADIMASSVKLFPTLPQ